LSVVLLVHVLLLLLHVLLLLLRVQLTHDHQAEVRLSLPEVGPHLCTQGKIPPGFKEISLST